MSYIPPHRRKGAADNPHKDLTPENLSRLGQVQSGSLRRELAEDDASSLSGRSTATSATSVNPSRHAEIKMQERALTAYNVQKIKKHGFIALHVLFEPAMSWSRAKKVAIDTAHKWCRKLEARFPDITARNTLVIERAQFPRVELHLANTGGLGGDLKIFLEREGYFAASRCHRLAYSLRAEEDLGGEYAETLVVEGGCDGAAGRTQAGRRFASVVRLTNDLFAMERFANHSSASSSRAHTAGFPKQLRRIQRIPIVAGGHGDTEAPGRGRGGAAARPSERAQRAAASGGAA